MRNILSVPFLCCMFLLGAGGCGPNAATTPVAASALQESQTESSQETETTTASETTTNTTSDTSTTGPSLTLGTPSSILLGSTGTSTIQFTYEASNSATVELTGTLTEGGGGITLTAVTGTPSCTIAVSSITTAGATITLSACTGNGSFTVHVDAGAVTDSLGNASTISAESSEISVDTTAPTLVSLTPATALVNPTPTTVLTSFSEEMNPLTAADFTLGGSCNSNPTKGTVQMSTDGQVATLSLSGGSCIAGQILTVLVNPAGIRDLAGNIGSGAAVTRYYTVSATGPSASLGTPSSTTLNLYGTSTIALSYTASPSGGTSISGSLTAGGGGVTVTTASGTPSCVVSVSGFTASSATITLSSCSGNGTLTVHANAGTATDALGNNSTVSGESALITVDNTGPTISSISPSSGSFVFTIPSSVVVTFSEAATAVAGNFSLTTSTCTTPPTVSSVSGSGTTAITVNLSGGSCTGSQMIVMVTTLSAITDAAGNAGSSTNTWSITYGNTKKFFMTASTHNGNFGGISGADSFCMSDSNKPVAGTYKAMITDGSTRVACTSSFCAAGGASEHVDWVLAANTQYTYTDGTTVIGATTSNGIFTFNLTHSLGTVGFPGGITWTGFDYDTKNWVYLSGCTCSGWASSSSGVSGCYGSGASSDTDGNSITYYSQGCNNSARVYCAEQ